MAKFLAAVALFALAVVLVSQPAPPERPGPTADGFLLNSGWKITPAGKQVPLDTFPMASAVSKDGQFLLILNGGYNPPSISVLRTGTMEELGRTPVEEKPSRLNRPTCPVFITVVFMHNAGLSGRSCSPIPCISVWSNVSASRFDLV